MPILRRRYKPDTLGGSYRPLSQTIGQSRDCVDIGDCSTCREYGSQNYSSGNLVLACSFSVGRLRLVQHTGLRSNFLAAESSIIVSAAATSARTTAAFATIAATCVTAIPRAIAAAVAGTSPAAVPLAYSVTGARS